MDSIKFQIGAFCFTWDERKNRANFKKHRIPFEEAATCWLDNYAIEAYDEAHSEKESRWRLIARSDLGRLLTCWYAERKLGDQEVVRIIGCRLSTPKERSSYNAEQ